MGKGPEVVDHLLHLCERQAALVDGLSRVGVVRQRSMVKTEVIQRSFLMQ